MVIFSIGFKTTFNGKLKKKIDKNKYGENIKKNSNVREGFLKKLILN